MKSFTTLKVSCTPNLIDALIAELFEVGFDSFQEFEDGFEASSDENDFDRSKVDEIIARYPSTDYAIKKQDKINWNKEWEKNYSPIQIDDRCIVRASFHTPRPDVAYEIIVTPKMSFGTGHHATTSQILAYQLGLDHTDRNVLDVGTGTGILAIMAQKRGASRIVATDIDEWCIENSAENFQLNEVNNVKLLKGEIDEIADENFDIITANINKNVLMRQIRAYSDKLKQSGQLIMSGFYEEDIADLTREAKQYNLHKIHQTTKDNWAMLVLSH